MKINWLVRFKNKTFLVTFATAVLTFIYQVLSIFDVVPALSQDNATQVVMLVINLLMTVGIVVDPTTKGISDSVKALTYDIPQ